MIKPLPQILIVDDIPTNLQLVAAVLDGLPYQLYFANSGADALKQIQQTRFDLVLLDIMMPEMDGLEVAQRIKSDPATVDLPIIFLTAQDDEDHLVEGFNIGASDYVTKPFSPSELISRMKTQLALKQARDELKHRNQELAEALQMKNKLLSIASHDLKTPLGAVEGFAQLMKRLQVIQEDKTASEMLSYILRAVARMQNLIRELLDTAALEMGKIDLKRELISPDMLLREVIQDYRPLAESKHQRIEAQLQSKCLLEADSHRLKQIFDNLISNALKYSPENAEISIVTYETSRKWEMHIKDQGPGFSEDDQQKLFGYFQKLSARPTGGENSTGIGLAIVKQIVELHQGSIRLARTSSEGSLFVVCLPQNHGAV